MPRNTYTVKVVGTKFGDRAALINDFALKGAKVQLRRASNSMDPQAIGVWVRCTRFWGLWRTWALIGFVEPDSSGPWAPKLDAGSMQVVALGFIAPMHRWRTRCPK
jgi:hypothetical protein